MRLPKLSHEQLLFVWALCIVAMTGGGLYLGKQAVRVLHRVDGLVAKVAADEDVLARKTTDMVDSARVATSEAAQASIEQRTLARKNAEQLGTTLHDLDALVQKTNTQLNETVLPQATATFGTIQTQFNNVGNATTGAMNATTKMAQDADRVIGDPNVGKILQSIADTGVNIQRGTKDTADILDIALGKVKEGTKKKSIAWALFMFLVRTGAGAGGWRH